MKLQRVLLARPIKLPGMAEPESEITDKECPGLHLDEQRGVVVFGDSNRERPREQAIEWERDNEQLVCADCGAEFANPQGMAGHMRTHKVQEKLVCPDCGEEFSSPQGYGAHRFHKHRKGSAA